jgi:hypothetical protein
MPPRSSLRRAACVCLKREFVFARGVPEGCRRVPRASPALLVGKATRVIPARKVRRSTSSPETGSWSRTSATEPCGSPSGHRGSFEVAGA